MVDEIIPARKSFLSLPPELRIKIYRYLLLSPLPMYRSAWYYHHCNRVSLESPWPFDFSTAVLSVCRQTWIEGGAILYGENVFALRISRARFTNNGRLEPFSSLWRFSSLEFLIAKTECTGFPIKRIRRIDFMIELGDEFPSRPIKHSIRQLCRFLSESSVPRCLNIILKCEPMDIRHASVLEPFTLLRNIQTINIPGIPPVYSHYLRNLMLEGSPPLDGLPRLYHELVESAGGFSFTKNTEIVLQDALEMMERGDSEGFLVLRNKIFDLYHLIEGFLNEANVKERIQCEDIEDEEGWETVSDESEKECEDEK